MPDYPNLPVGHSRLRPPMTDSFSLLFFKAAPTAWASRQQIGRVVWPLRCFTITRGAQWPFLWLQFPYLNSDLSSFPPQRVEDPDPRGKGNEVALRAWKVAVQTSCEPRGQNKPAGCDWRQAAAVTGRTSHTPPVPLTPPNEAFRL